MGCVDDCLKGVGDNLPHPIVSVCEHPTVDFFVAFHAYQQYVFVFLIPKRPVVQVMDVKISCIKLTSALLAGVVVFLKDVQSELFPLIAVKMVLIALTELRFFG